MDSTKLENYKVLLSIRRAAGRRNMVIQGGIFIIMFIAMIALGLLDQLNARSLYLVTAIMVPLGFGYLTTWVKLEIVKETIALIENTR